MAGGLGENPEAPTRAGVTGGGRKTHAVDSGIPGVERPRFDDLIHSPFLPGGS